MENTRYLELNDVLRTVEKASMYVNGVEDQLHGLNKIFEVYNEAVEKLERYADIHMEKITPVDIDEKIAKLKEIQDRVKVVGELANRAGRVEKVEIGMTFSTGKRSVSTSPNSDSNIPNRGLLFQNSQTAIEEGLTHSYLTTIISYDKRFWTVVDKEGDYFVLMPDERTQPIIYASEKIIKEKLFLVEHNYKKFYKIDILTNKLSADSYDIVNKLKFGVLRGSNEDFCSTIYEAEFAGVIEDSLLGTIIRGYSSREVPKNFQPDEIKITRKHEGREYNCVLRRGRRKNSHLYKPLYSGDVRELFGSKKDSECTMSII